MPSHTAAARDSQVRPMKRILLLISVLLAVACSSYEPPRTQPRANRETPIQAPAEQVWRDVLRYFSDHNIPIDNMDHSSFFMKTRPVDVGATYGGVALSPKAIPITNRWCDCGKGTLANVWSSETRIMVSFNIVLEQKNEAPTTVRINAFFEGVILGKRSLYASGYDTQIRLTCVSTGSLEQEIGEYLRKGQP
jgi:hypothetical protein